MKSEHLYMVHFDQLEYGRYVPHYKLIFAQNAKAACEALKAEYWANVDAYMERRNCTTTTARRAFSWPFHIRAERADHMEVNA